MSSTPSFTEFDPREIEWQMRSIQEARKFDYSKGVLETFSSGSIGSAKTIKDIHEIIKHCLESDGARYLMVRRTLKDLKRTSWNDMLEHIRDIPHMVKQYHKTDMKITFINGSEIIGDSYEKGDLDKFRSLLLSGADFEEATECTKEVYEAIKMRVGRIPHVRKNRITARSNPDEPDHWLHKYFLEDQDHPNKLIYFSLTEQNKFLPKWYIENLKRDLDPLMARRMLKGEWLSIRGEKPYYAYDPDKQFKKNKSYVFNPRYPVDFMHDFNIGQGKPMSMAIGQYINDQFHIGKEFIIEGFNTAQLMDEIADAGILELITPKFRIFGDCNGDNKDTRGSNTDYDIIMKFMSNYKTKLNRFIIVEKCVARSNPLVRQRQNMVNTYCTNDLGENRLIIYKDAPTVDEGLRLTKLKKGSTYQEDDSDRFQHVVTGLGYYIHRQIDHLNEFDRPMAPIRMS